MESISKQDQNGIKNSSFFHYTYAWHHITSITWLVWGNLYTAYNGIISIVQAFWLRLVGTNTKLSMPRTWSIERQKTITKQFNVQDVKYYTCSLHIIVSLTLWYWYCKHLHNRYVTPDTIYEHRQFHINHEMIPSCWCVFIFVDRESKSKDTST